MTLANWLMNLDCKNYFMSKCNLLSHKISEENFDIVVEKLLPHSDVNSLKEWFARESTSYHHQRHESKTTLTFADCQRLSEIPDLDDQKFPLCEFFIKRMNLLMRGCVENSLVFVGVCVNNMSAIDDFFVDFYKGHLMLQATTFIKVKRLFDNVLASLSTLFFNRTRGDARSPLFCHSSVFQLFSRKYYYEIAKIVLTDQMACFATDYFVTIKLVIILIKRELGLKNVYPEESDKIGLYLHLAHLYFVTERYEKCTKYMKLAVNPPTFKLSNPLSWISGRYLMFIDDVATAVGLQCLTKRDEACEDPSFPISLHFFKRYLLFSYQLKQAKQKMCNLLTCCDPKTVTDLFLVRRLQHRNGRNKQVVLHSLSNDPSTRKSAMKKLDGILVTKEDKFYDSLIKYAVIHFTEFFRRFREIKHVKENDTYILVHNI